jgi:hypothetical protein
MWANLGLQVVAVLDCRADICSEASGNDEDPKFPTDVKFTCLSKLGYTNFTPMHQI